MRQDVNRWIDTFVNVLCSQVSAHRLRSILLFGSWVEDGPCWRESDVDILIVPPPDDCVDVAFLQGVARTIQAVAVHIPYQITPVIRNWDEVMAMTGPLCCVLHASSATARTVYGEDLVSLFAVMASTYATYDLQRSALCALLLTNQHLRAAATSLHWASDTRLLLCTCLKVVRCAYWASSGTFPNSFRCIVELAQEHFAGVKSIHLLPVLYQVLMLNDPGPHVSLVQQALDLTEALTNEVKCRFRAFDNASLLDIRMSF